MTTIKPSIVQLLFENGADPKVGFIIATVIGYCLYKCMMIMSRRRCSEDHKQTMENVKLEESDDNYKLALVVRSDLKMGKGKIAAQCSHAAVAAYKAATKYPLILDAWEDCGQAKITLKVDNETTLMSIAKHAKSIGLLSNVVQDAGKTQIAPGSKTVCGIGPGPAGLIDQVTGHLKLY